MIPAPTENRRSNRPPYPKISFVIPAHNEADYIEKTIRNIHESADQLQLEYELIVVNDSSTDQTATIAKAMRASVIDVQLRNIGAVRNAGAKAATGQWLFFVDADTCLPPQTLELALRAMLRGAAGGGAQVEIDDPGKVAWTKKLLYFTVRFVWQTVGYWAAGCFMFCRRDYFFHFGGFDEQYFAAEELFFSRNLKAMGPFRIVRHPVVTSSRKFHSYSTGEMLKFVFLPLIHPGGRFRSRQGLDLLYRHDR